MLRLPLDIQSRLIFKAALPVSATFVAETGKKMECEGIAPRTPCFSDSHLLLAWAEPRLCPGQDELCLICRKVI